VTRVYSGITFDTMHFEYEPELWSGEAVLE